MHKKMFEVSFAEMEDAEAILEITKESFEEYRKSVGVDTVDALTETVEDVEQAIREQIVLVAHIEENVVGSLRLKLMGDGTAYLSRFGVKLSCQNLGIGKSLVNMADAILQSRGVKQVRLHTGAKVTGLIRFYYGRGFYIDSTTKDRGYIRALLCKDYV